MSQPPYPPQPSAENDPARAPEPPYDPAHPAQPTEPGYDPPRPPRPAERAYDPAYPPQPTGPMDGGFPAPPPPLPGPEVSTGPRVGVRPARRSTADRAALTALVLGALGVVLLVAGLSMNLFEGGPSSWTAIPAWAVFATLAALVALVPHVPSRGGLSPAQVWQVGVAGAAGVVVSWLLVVVFTGAGGTNRGFVLTLATALVAGSVWLARRRSA
ncbi:hypothetical protein [Klenkia marina]|uniref:hypothetical protein n=1 Tax=Klenkia marina TaxID=1960309 RepID=UPI000B89A79C|nr:hypothetical protein [Klenkia marina]